MSATARKHDEPLEPEGVASIGSTEGTEYATRGARGLRSARPHLRMVSPLRPERFVTQKIVKVAGRIAAGSDEKLELGNVSVVRDWGWAPEYVEAMWLLLQQERPDDFVIATGQSVSLREFVAMTFEHFGLDWRGHVVENDSLFRPLDIQESRANPAKAAHVLGWTARTRVRDVIALLADTR